MEILHGAPGSLETAMGIDVTGRRYLIALAKAAYQIPDTAGRVCAPAEQQPRLVSADEFEGEPGLSAPVFESDHALRRRHCDVVVRAAAHAEHGRPVPELRVGFRVGARQKWARVVGERSWRSGVLGLTPSAPTPFVHMPISYGRSYGGAWPGDGDKDPGDCYRENPVGHGYASRRHERHLRDAPVPNIETPGQPVTSPACRVRPCAFGPVGRGWSPRCQYAGTYGQAYLDERFPLLPLDFDERYFQSAPQDQQIPYPTGGEPVELWGLLPQSAHHHFVLPPLALPMMAITRTARPIRLDAVVDTLTVDLFAGIVSVVWRALLPVRHSMREVEVLASGNVCKRWWSARVYGSGDCGCGGKETDDDDLAPVTEALESP